MQATKLKQKEPRLSPSRAPGPGQNSTLGKGSKRITSIDVCKGIAVLGMMFMNFKIAVLQNAPDFFSYSFLTSMEGRFGVLFIFMAGVGLSLMTSRARRNNETKQRMESILKLLGRTIFLFVLGMLFSLYWQADILHFYAVYILIAIPFLFAPDTVVVAAAVVSFLGAIGLHFFFEWETGWNWLSFTYDGFYTIEGFIRNIMFNGFHPVFPWVSFLFLGMYVGRQNLRNSVDLKRMFVIGGVIFLVCELSVGILLQFLEPSLATFILNTTAFPTTPTYVISAGGMAVAVLSGAILLERRLNFQHPAALVLQSSGSTVMTLYTSHLLIGLPFLIGLHSFMDIGLPEVTIFTVIYYLFSLLAIHAWKKRFSFGPLETLMRRIHG